MNKFTQLWSNLRSSFWFIHTFISLSISFLTYMTFLLFLLFVVSLSIAIAFLALSL